MKPRPVIIGISLGLCVATVAGVAVQARRLDALRAVEQQLQLEIQMVETNGVVTRPSISPSSELLRLRNQVSMLSRRQRELAAVPAENERLRARIAASRTNAVGALPPGYIRKSEARFVGYTTPENTLETILWALRNHDLTNLMTSFTLESVQEKQEEMGGAGEIAGEFFKKLGGIPGMNVVGRTLIADDHIALQVEIFPGHSPETVRFRLVNGAWKMD